MPIDYELLEQQLGIVTKERQDALLTVAAAGLTDRERMESFLKFYQEQIKGLDIQVAATYFASAWRVVCTALQYMLSVTPSRLRFSLENITIQVAVVNQFPWVYFVLNDPEETPWPQGERDAWRENELGGILPGGVAPGDGEHRRRIRGAADAAVGADSAGRAILRPRDRRQAGG